MNPRLLVIWPLLLSYAAAFLTACTIAVRGADYEEAARLCSANGGVVSVEAIAGFDLTLITKCVNGARFTAVAPKG
jgi:hypothetical protein